jgi:hypothetical protein
MDSVVDNYEVIDRYIAEDLTEIEHQVFGEHRPGRHLDLPAQA